jgi:hypothetical protein
MATDATATAEDDLPQQIHKRLCNPGDGKNTDAEKARLQA